MTRCRQLVKQYSLAPKFTHRRGVHIGRQYLMTLYYTSVTFLDTSNARKFHCLEIVAPAMARRAGALPPAMLWSQQLSARMTDSIVQCSGALSPLKYGLFPQYRYHSSHKAKFVYIPCKVTKNNQ